MDGCGRFEYVLCEKYDFQRCQDAVLFIPRGFLQELLLLGNGLNGVRLSWFFWARYSV